MTLTTGRTLDENGDPVPGTGFRVERDSWLAERIAERTGPITSHPTRPVWGIPLDGPGDVVRTLSVFGAGYTGPPEHYHLRSQEAFDVREGSITMTLDGDERRVEAGETATVDTGVVHGFRNAGDQRALVITNIHDPGTLRQVLPTLGGLAHDPEADPEDPFQQVAIADRLDGNTVFTDGEGGLRGAAAEVLAPVAKLAGYRGAYDRYGRDAFWRRHVEQPDLSRENG
jgi:mannose-6-phosphate isomerase-like protein (cupin superfamily)